MENSKADLKSAWLGKIIFHQFSRHGPLVRLSPIPLGQDILRAVLVRNHLQRGPLRDPKAGAGI